MPARPKAKLKYDFDLYTPRALMESGIPVKELEREYMRLRAIANKRLQRFEQNGTYVWTQAYKSNVGRYKEPVTQLKGQQLYYKLSGLARFIHAEAGSVSGQKRIEKKTIETLRQNSYTFVNKKNFKYFVRYMEKYKSSKLLQIYDSDEVVNMFKRDAAAGLEEVSKTLDDFESRFTEAIASGELDY